MVKKKGKTVKKLEDPTEQEPESVTTVSEVTPEEEPTPEPETQENKFKILEPVVVPEDQEDEIVTVKVTHGSVGILGLGTFEQGDTFETTRLRASQLDQRFIRIV